MGRFEGLTFRGKPWSFDDPSARPADVIFTRYGVMPATLASLVETFRLHREAEARRAFDAAVDLAMDDLESAEADVDRLADEAEKLERAGGTGSVLHITIQRKDRSQPGLDHLPHYPLALCGHLCADEFEPNRADTAGRDRCVDCLRIAAANGLRR